MTHTITSVRYRIGHNIHWNVFYSSFYFNKGMRLQIVLTLSLKYIMAIIGVEVIKLFLAWETRILKFNIIGIRLTDVIKQESLRRDVVAEKDVETIGIWSSPVSVRAYEAYAHHRLDNNIYNIAYFLPSFRKSDISASLNFSDVLPTVSDGSLYRDDTDDDAEEHSHDGKEVMSRKTGFVLDATIFRFILKSGFMGRLLKKNNLRHNPFYGHKADAGLTTHKLFTYVMSNIIEVDSSNVVINPSPLRTVANLFSIETMALFKSLQKSGLITESWNKEKSNLNILLFKEFRALVSNPRLLFVALKKNKFRSVEKLKRLVQHYRFVLFFFYILKLKKKKNVPPVCLKTFYEKMLSFFD